MTYKKGTSNEDVVKEVSSYLKSALYDTRPPVIDEDTHYKRLGEREYDITTAIIRSLHRATNMEDVRKIECELHDRAYQLRVRHHITPR